MQRVHGMSCRPVKGRQRDDVGGQTSIQKGCGRPPLEPATSAMIAGPMSQQHVQFAKAIRRDTFAQHPFRPGQVGWTGRPQGRDPALNGQDAANKRMVGGGILPAGRRDQ